ncbi:MAG TPA: nuclear transport factor 2 family protein [Mycobacterium sp.]|jgi:RNA polymerase sigma-70 factor (ECF subfamily)|nr:nuclear transport factor 2 family protein [Mycobacterium sp.]
MQHRAVVERFIAACAVGDIAELMAVLDPDVNGHAELIGFGTVADLSGRPAVAQRLIGMFGPGTGTLLVPVAVEGDAAVVAYAHGRVAAVVRFDHEGGRIRHLRSVVIPPTARR